MSTSELVCRRRRASQQNPSIVIQIVIRYLLMSSLLIDLQIVNGQKLRWCDYLHVLGVISEECAPDDSSLEKARQVEKREFFKFL